MFLYIFVLCGFTLSVIFDFRGVHNEQWYLLTVAILLAAGLYGSTYGINITKFKKNIGLIIKAITIGVVLKALVVGTLFFLIFQNPFGFIFGIVVAQIDPLSTAALMRGNRISKNAQSILRAWSSFDDPMTVILSLYAPVAVTLFTGIHWQSTHGVLQETSVMGYFIETGINILFAAGIAIVWQLMKRHSKATNYFVIGLVALGMYGLFLGALSIAVYYFWMLGIAILGLFMRPPIEKALSYIVQWSLILAAVLLGILLINGIAFWEGFVLGIIAYCAQIFISFPLTRNLPIHDRFHIAFAQQNGITSIILALLFESYHSGTVAVIAPAIIIINTTHALSNNLLDIYLARDFEKLKVQYYLHQLMLHMHKI